MGFTGLGQGMKEGLHFSEDTTYFAYLSLLVASTQLLVQAMRTWDRISSLRSLIKHSQKKALDMPSFLKARNSKAAIKSSTVPYCFNFSNGPNGWC